MLFLGHKLKINDFQFVPSVPMNRGDSVCSRTYRESTQCNTYTRRSMYLTKPQVLLRIVCRVVPAPKKLSCLDTGKLSGFAVRADLLGDRFSQVGLVFFLQVFLRPFFGIFFCSTRPTTCCSRRRHAAGAGHRPAGDAGP